MKNRYLAAILGGATIIIMGSSGGTILSAGAPVGSTNAPGEQSCGKSGCHTGDNGQSNINTGTGILSITSQQDLSNYIPGQTYDITVSIAETGIERFGFALTALDENNNKVGTLLVTDQQRTQIFQGALQFSGRDYMTYRSAGTDPYEPGKGRWTFQWKAPDISINKVTFYAAAIAANNDGTDNGDLVYTQKLVSKGLGVDKLNNNTSSFSIFPNPAKDLIHVQFKYAVTEPISFALYDVWGKQIRELQDVKVSADGKTFSIPLHDTPVGVYYFKVVGSSISETKQVLLTN